MPKLSKPEFSDSLKKGRGRALLHVREHGDDGIEDEILNASLHNLAYDPQCEGNRGEWVFKMLTSTRNPEFYYKKILGNFIESKEFWDVSQQSTILNFLAKQDYPGAREALYRKFDLQEFPGSSTIGMDLIDLDGVDGMIYVADNIGKRTYHDDKYDYSAHAHIINIACDKFGKKSVFKAIDEKSKEN